VSLRCQWARLTLLRTFPQTSRAASDSASRARRRSRDSTDRIFFRFNVRHAQRHSVSTFSSPTCRNRSTLSPIPLIRQRWLVDAIAVTGGRKCGQWSIPHRLSFKERPSSFHDHPDRLVPLIELLITGESVDQRFPIPEPAGTIPLHRPSPTGIKT
jgi:hypothetical protein